MVMSYFFNCDLEDFLSSKKEKYQINSNKQNQEFEYFILWLENEALFTHKSYDDSYIRFINQFKKIELTTDKSQVKLWCAEIWNKEKQKIENSKIESVTFGIKNELCHPKTKIIEDKIEICEGDYIYKEEFGVSGIGTWKYNQLPKNISLPLIKDPLLKRKFDFSTLIDGNKSTVYQNHIDDSFQYKGTTVGMKFDYFEWFEKYLNNIDIIKNKFASIKGPWSIDSFIYEENNTEKVYCLSEINARKTMGYITLKLKDFLFPDFKYARLRIITNKKIKHSFIHSRVFENFEKKIIPLSPLDNIFSVFLIAEDSLGELNELEDELFDSLI
jgi:hypothetical protein